MWGKKGAGGCMEGLGKGAVDGETECIDYMGVHIKAQLPLNFPQKDKYKVSYIQ